MTSVGIVFGGCFLTFLKIGLEQSTEFFLPPLAARTWLPALTNALQ